MAIWRKSKTKPNGTKIKRRRKKKKRELGRLPRLTKIGEVKKRKIRMLGGKRKTVLLSTNVANIYDPKSKSWKVAKILDVLENKANRQYVRMKVLTKGAIIETEIGKARITNRPGQEGGINAILIE